jgi:hypothetical protein
LIDDEGQENNSVDRHLGTASQKILVRFRGISELVAAVIVKLGSGANVGKNFPTDQLGGSRGTLNHAGSRSALVPDKNCETNFPAPALSIGDRAALHLS